MYFVILDKIHAALVLEINIKNMGYLFKKANIFIRRKFQTFKICLQFLPSFFEGCLFLFAPYYCINNLFSTYYLLNVHRNGIYNIVDTIDSSKFVYLTKIL